MDKVTGDNVSREVLGFPFNMIEESKYDGADLDIGFNDVESFAKEFDAPPLCVPINQKDFPHLDSKSYSVVGMKNRRLREVVIPDYYDDGVHGRHPVTTIEGHAFAGSGVEKVVIPSTVIRLFNQAFDGCVSLKQINIPDSVVWIRSFCFDGCVSLKKIHLPRSVERIGGGAFDECRNLEIYTDHLSKPEGWAESWNRVNRPVYWEGRWAWVNGVPTALEDSTEG